MILISLLILTSNCKEEDTILFVYPDFSVSDNKFSAQKEFSYAIDLADQSELLLNGINGTITITEDSTMNTVKITGERIVKSTTQEDANTRLNELKVEIEELTGEIRVSTIQPDRSEGRNYIINYDITLPKNIDVNIQNVNGSVSLREIHTNTTVHLANGNIDANVILPLDGFIDLKVINGSIDLEIPENTSAELSAIFVNGYVDVSRIDLNAKVEKLNSLVATCGNGDGTISLATTNGGIKVRGY